MRRAAGMLLALVATLSVAPYARALDIVMGAETLFNQVDNAKLVMVARYRGPDSGTLIFERQTVLAGASPDMLRVEADENALARPLTAGTAYLLCLSVDASGKARLPLSFHSILPVSSAELPRTLDAVRVFLRDRADPARIEASLLELAASDSAFLQTSAVTWLSDQQRITRPGLARLMELVSSGRIREARPRELVLIWAGMLRAVELRRAVEARLLDAGEQTSVREVALGALGRMDSRFVSALMPELERRGTPQLVGLARSVEQNARTRGR